MPELKIHISVKYNSMEVHMFLGFYLTQPGLIYPSDTISVSSIKYVQHASMSSFFRLPTLPNQCIHSSVQSPYFGISLAFLCWNSV